jgi:hypothetical protein
MAMSAGARTGSYRIASLPLGTWPEIETGRVRYVRTRAREAGDELRLAYRLISRRSQSLPTAAHLGGVRPGDVVGTVRIAAGTIPGGQRSNGAVPTAWDMSTTREPPPAPRGHWRPRRVRTGSDARSRSRPCPSRDDRAACAGRSGR